MKINKINPIYNQIQPYKTSFQKNKEKREAAEKKVSNTAILLSLAGAAGLVAGIIYFKRKPASEGVTQTTDNVSREISSYIKDLALGLEKYTGKKISPETLSSVMTLKEFLKEVKELKKENYIPSKANIENGIFRADLHSHSKHSDGKANVEDIMNQVAEYADKLNAKNGKKFIYALTDHDNIDGVKEALKIISENPEKFKNVKFVTGSELSFLIKSTKTTNPCETSELLAYGFNPFSEKVETFFTELKNRRLESRKNYINELNNAFPEINFSEEEFLKIFLSDKKSHNPMMNSYWQLYHYGQIKLVLANTAKAKGLNPEKYFEETMKKAPKNLNLEEFKRSGLIENWISENDTIKQINNKYKPSLNKDGSINKTCENLISDIASAFKDEKEFTSGFAHPYYISERNNNVNGIIVEIKKELGDKLKLTESYHQAYAAPLVQKYGNEIGNINTLCESKGLLPIGGRDNHESKWL